MLQTWNTQSIRKPYLSQSHYFIVTYWPIFCADCRVQTMWIVDFHLVVNDCVIDTIVINCSTVRCTSVWITIFIKSATCSSLVHLLTKTSL